MANTTYLKTTVEPFVRSALRAEFGVEFRSRVVTLLTGGSHEFDAVSDDGQVVAAIKSASGKTSGGKNPSGKIKDAEAELYYLTLVNARTRILVLTNQEFYGILQARLRGRLAAGLSLKLVGLPPEMTEEVRRIQREASAEVSKNTPLEGFS